MAVKYFVCKCSYFFLNNIHFNLTFIVSIKSARMPRYITNMELEAVSNKGKAYAKVHFITYMHKIIHNARDSFTLLSLFSPLLSHSFSLSASSIRTHAHTHTQTNQEHICNERLCRFCKVLFLNQGIHNQHNRVSLSIKLYIRLIMISVCMRICFLLYVRCERIK